MRAASYAIVGTVGIPACYGGFETLAEALARHHAARRGNAALAVYCSARQMPRRAECEGARLRYLPLRANGAESVLYDALALLDAARRGDDAVLLLGVSGAWALPLVRRLSDARIVTNVDGCEWRRAKWGPLARIVLRLSEAAAVRWSDALVADNPAVAEGLLTRYGRAPQVLAYGGDQALAHPPEPLPGVTLPEDYALAICRAEPENNLALILETWPGASDLPLVVVSNWQDTAHGRALLARYREDPRLHLLPATYAPGPLRWIREGARAYLHGHSAGGTNPSLVEMMFFGVPVLACDTPSNRQTTAGRAFYFEDGASLAAQAPRLLAPEGADQGRALAALARARYRWAEIAEGYFDLLAPRSD
ncbi:DUF1972 domain-containing protein [Roseivivax sp. GX 12232]|uniref:DUF1972 domain-containing protein n=1 Tax=Roseivivax sp. GX 12232 TaxID=2900547 RepID=UPI001E327867|nr:DUF1972 domain-containing protein [Roseivivax sp. GX 12232]MCE0507194.1 DUF1972 domain-containing protein [Roseivivax sp. GX 12232]